MVNSACFHLSHCSFFLEWSALAWWLMPRDSGSRGREFEPHSGQTVLCPLARHIYSPKVLVIARFPLHSCHLMFKTMNKIKTINNLKFLCLYIPNNISSLHMCNETSTNLWAVFTISACPTPCWFDSRQKSLSKDRGNYKLRKYGKPC